MPRKKKKNNKKKPENNEKPSSNIQTVQIDDEYEVIKSIADKVIKVYIKNGRTSDAERMKKLLEKIRNKNARKQLLGKIINEMFDTLDKLIKEDYIAALQYFIKCLNTPDTILAYIYVFRPEYAELMISITAKALELVRVMGSRHG